MIIRKKIISLILALGMIIAPISGVQAIKVNATQTETVANTDIPIPKTGKVYYDDPLEYDYFNISDDLVNIFTQVDMKTLSSIEKNIYDDIAEYVKKYVKKNPSSFSEAAKVNDSEKLVNFVWNLSFGKAKWILTSTVRILDQLGMNGKTTMDLLNKLNKDLKLELDSAVSVDYSSYKKNLVAILDQLRRDLTKRTKGNLEEYGINMPLLQDAVLNVIDKLISENKDSETIINAIYGVLFSRTSDPEGMAYWKNKLQENIEKGKNLRDAVKSIIPEIVDSSEFLEKVQQT